MSRCFAVPGLMLLVGCGATSDWLQAADCDPGSIACSEGCCALCVSDADCGAGKGCDADGLCTASADPCGNLDCPLPAPACADAGTLKVFAPGGCADGACLFDEVLIPCEGGCASGHCVGCTPSSCAELGYSCGLHVDDCGNTIDCGGCGLTCASLTCAELGFECGAQTDNCGKPIACGGCTGGESCDAAGLCACADLDGDGFASTACGGNDCNDNDATIHPGALETCDGVDQDCDGKADDVMPATYDTATWVPDGFYGLPAGILVTFGDQAAWWDPSVGGVTGTKTLGEVWDFFGTNKADQPPLGGIDTILFLRQGNVLGEDQSVDQVVVTAGTTAYVADPTYGWWAAPVTAWYIDADQNNRLFPAATITASALIRAADLGLAGDLLLVASGTQLWVFDASVKTWTGPTTVASYFYPAGSSGGAPSNADELMFMPGGAGYVQLVDGNRTLGSAMNHDGAGKLFFTWMPVNMAAVGCVL